MRCSNETRSDSVLIATTLLGLFQSFSFCIYHIGSSQMARSFTQIIQTALLNFVIGSLLWFTIGYSLVFGQSQKGFIGSLNHALLLDLQDTKYNESLCTTGSQPDVVMATFEMTFAITAPIMAFITWVDYLKPSASWLFITLWPIIVYYPVAHWVRGGGWLTTVIPVLDFAGGLTLHTTTGSAHFLLTFIMKRTFSGCDKISLLDRHSQKTNENLQTVILATGSFLTVLGWYSLNIGSLRNLDNFYSLVLLNTHFAACATVIFWLIVSYIVGKWSILNMFNGLMVGLAGASAISGYVHTWSALLIGSVVGFITCGLFTIMSNHVSSMTRGKAVDVTYIFGVPGILGTIAVGLFSTTSIDGTVENGAFFSNGNQFLYQLVGIVVVVVWSLLWTLLLLKFIHSTVGLFLHESDFPTSFLKDAKHEDLHGHNSEDSLKESLIRAAKHGKLYEIQELREKFTIDLGLKDFNERTPLHYVCESGHTKCVEYLLEQRDVKVHARDRYGATPLTEAVRKHRDDIIELLLQNGASWTTDGVGETLCNYVLEGKVDEVRRLKRLGMDLNATDTKRQTALHVAACKGDKVMVECLIDMNVHLNKVDLLGNRPLNCAEMHEEDEISEILVRHGALRLSQNYNQHEICDEASKGNLRMLRHMVHNGANVSYCDEKGRTPLHRGSRCGHLDVVTFLLDQPGVNINAKDKKNHTPLTDAIYSHHNDVAEYLQLHGGEVEERRMMHLICKATRQCDRRLLKQLLLWFSGGTVVDYDGESVHHICVKLGDVNMLKIIAKTGLNFRERNFLGSTPLELAIQMKSRHAIINILSELEEGKYISYSCEASPRNKVKHIPNHKSKIRRRRTRRQTRVEVANEHLPEVLREAKENHTLKTIAGHANAAKVVKVHANGVQKDFVGQRVNEGKTKEEEEEKEVTLADIELMNRRKHYFHEPRFAKMVGAPQFV